MTGNSKFLGYELSGIYDRSQGGHSSYTLGAYKGQRPEFFVTSRMSLVTKITSFENNDEGRIELLNRVATNHATARIVLQKFESQENYEVRVEEPPDPLPDEELADSLLKAFANI